MTKNPPINQISLQLLQDYYDHYLYPNKYCFELENLDVIEVLFNKKNLCHLLGIVTVIEKAIHMSQHFEYKGIRGYTKIKDGTLTINELKRIDKKRFGLSKDKMVFFYWIHKILESPNLVLKYQQTSESHISCDFLLYDIRDGHAIAHLGLVKDGNVYYPKSFFIERVTEHSDGKKHITDQEEIRIVSVSKVPRTT